MSAIISQAQRHYRTVFLWQCGLFLVVCGGVAIQYSVLAFLLGGLAGFLPHCLFVYWVFFRPVVKNSNKMTAFYRGEGLKWGATLFLVSAVLVGVPDLQVATFFAGYFFMLLCNGLLPILLTQQAN